ncbi:MAG: M48 family metalloprotease [Alphaproteobacteria bacterium]
MTHRLILPSLLSLLAATAHAQTMVLDAEFSDYANRLTKPLLGNLPHTQGVSFVLIGDDSLNAYVDAEKVVHVHAGLFLNAKGSGDIQGVLAHELGHISSQHLLKMGDNIKTATLSAIAGAVVGVGAAVAGAPQVAAAAMAGGQALGVSQMLKFSRTQEQEADQRGIAALHGAGYSAQGMLNTFNRLRLDTQLSYGSLPPYLLTHPLPETRLQSLQRAVATEAASQTLSEAEFARISAKVYALTHTSPATLRKFNGTTEVDAYARALAYTAQGKLDDAARELTPLLAAHPNDVFYHELAAQIAVQRGNLAEAAEGFHKVLSQRPDLLLVRFQLADVQRNLGDMKAAAANYRTITEQWAVWADPWRGLGLCYGAMGQLPLSHLSLAQAAVYSANPVEAKAQLAIAQTYLAKTPDAEATSWAEALEAGLKDVDVTKQ